MPGAIKSNPGAATAFTLYINNIDRQQSENIYVRNCFNFITKLISTNMLCNSNVAMPGIEQRFSWIKEHTPCFGVSGSDVMVLHEPGEFYVSLKVVIQILIL